jgi:hypothetical protein
LAELLAWPPRLDTGAINPYLPLTLGAAQVGIAALGVLGWLVLARRRSVIPSAALAPRAPRAEARSHSGEAERREIPPHRVLWGTGLSEPVWTLLPFVDLFEWPFRWHGLAALGLSWLAGAAVAGGTSLAPGRMRPALATVLGGTLLALLLGAALVQLYPHKLLPGTRRMSPAEVVRYEVKSSTVGSTSLGEFNPIWVAQPLHTSPLVEAYRAGEPVNRLPQPLPPGVTGVPLETTAHRHSFRLQVAAPTTLTLSLLYFPGWQATADGAALAIAPHADSGLIDVALPAGDYTLALTFHETPLRRAADLVSAAAWVGLAAVGIVWAWRRGGVRGNAGSEGRTVAPRLQRGEPGPPAAHGKHREPQGYKPWATGEGKPVLGVAVVVAGMLACWVSTRRPRW